MLRMLLEPYVIIPVILVLVGITCIKERHMSIYLFALALIIGWMSFHITGLDERYDLYWHFETLDEFRRLGKDYFDVTMKKCLWHTACVENGCEELCPLFCDVDDITYGGLKKIGFKRTKTLGYGGDCCGDFVNNLI